MANKLSEEILGAVSAYAIAKEHGYTGTEQEWIEELMATTQNAQDAKDAAEFVEERTFGVVIRDHTIRFDEREVVTDSLAQRAETAAQSALDAVATAKGHADRAETAANSVNMAISGTAQSSIIANEFSTGRTYPVGAYVTYNGKLYTCIDAVTVQGAWDANKWQETKVTDFASIPLDDTLETEGVAADAKAVGDAIEEIRESTTQIVNEANAWQTQGTNGQIMSKKEGIATWIDAPVPDITLSLVGESADAKAVGDALEETNAWKTQGNNNQILSVIDGEVTWIDNPPVDATLSIENQPADAKAVGARFDETEAWKNQGTENQILSRDNNGIKWIDNPPVDATLTVENQPADAKAVGEILRSHDSRISNAATDATSALTKTGVLDVTVATQDEILDEMQTTVNDMASVMQGLINNAEVIDGRLVFMHDDEELFSVPWGGGGGGGSQDSVVMTSQLTTGWLSKNTIKTDIPVTFTWSSLENELETGPGRAVLECNGYSSETTIEQGECTVTIQKDWLLIGKNTVKLYIYDSQNHTRRHTLTVNASDVNLESSLDNSTPYYNSVYVSYTPYGKVSKVVHFVLDGEEIGATETTLSGTTLEYIIPQQEAGIHTFEMYITATIGEDNISTDPLYYELIWLDEFSDRPFITLSTTGGEVEQFETVNIPFRVYTRNKLYTDVDVYINDVLFKSLKNLTTDQQMFSYVFEDATDPDNENDVVTISFLAPNMIQPRTISYRVRPSEISISAETTGLTLYLDSKNRSNNEENWDTWEYNDIQAEFTNFNKKFDGWQIADDGYNVLRIENNARVYIPFRFFDRDFSSNGATFEIEFSTRRVIDYNAEIFTCLEGTKGFRFTPTLVQFNTGTQIWARFSDNEHVRVSYVFDRSDYNDNERLIKIYINGVWSKTVWYSSNERTSQTNPVGISIGSNDAAIDIYCIRAYNRMLTDRQIVNNYLADMRNKTEMALLYRQNDIYNENNQITPESIRSKIPIIILSCPELPQSKEDEKTAKVEYYNDSNPAFSFETVLDATIAGQGTSSSAYYRKNLSVKFPKDSILMNNTSTPISNYALTAESIPFNSFVLKKDVASSEGANNVQGCMIYNDFCPYKTPEMIENPKYRWGIEGYPAVLFWRNTTDNSIEFIGKTNFNLPKRMPGPLGYPDDKDQLANEDVPSRLESWEIENNNTENVKFQSSNFEGEAWKDDFEARIPNKYYVTDKIKEFTEFVASCNMHKATNAQLSSPVTLRLDANYSFKNFTQSEGKYTYTTDNNIYVVRFTHDTACYRLSRFRALAPEYMQMESFCWYYVWAFIFLAADSYAKNLFIGFRGDAVSENGPVQHYKRKAVAEVYDADTILGIDNLGNLVLSPFLIDTDYVIQNSDASEYPRTDDPTQEKVWDAQDTVLFENIRIAFWDTCRSVLADAIARGFTAENVISRFRAHRNKWGASIYNADANSTYIITHIKKLVKNANNQYDYDHTYLPKLLGDKDSQMAWFTRKRWRYVSSMYSVGDANNIFISFRVSKQGSITIWPIHDLYVGMRFGEGGTNQVQRVFAGESATFTLDSGGAEISRYECRILSGDLIKRIDGLAEMKAAFVNFSMASSLQEITLGGEEGNSYLNDFHADNCPLLKKLNLMNCPNVTGEIRLENSPILEEVYLEGTAISSISLAEGCQINTLHLPGTINALMLIDLPNLMDLQVESYDNIDRFFFKDVNSSIDLFEIMSNLKENTEINIDFDITLQTSEDIYELLDMFDTMRGIYRQKNSQGIWDYFDDEDDPDNPGMKRPLKAQVSGVIHIDTVNGSDVEVWQNRYPYIEIDAAHSTAIVTFKTWDGVDTIGTIEVIDKVLQTATPTIPSRASTAQYDYTPVGWSKLNDDVANRPEALLNIVGNTTVFAAYSRTIRTYTVIWKNFDNTILETDNNVPYGTMPTYNGSTPMQEGQPYIGWYPIVSLVNGDITYTAQYKPVYTATFVLGEQDGNVILTTQNVVEGSTANYTGMTPISSRGTAEELEFIGWVPTFNAMYSDVTYTAIFKDNRSVVIQYLSGDLVEFSSENINKISSNAFYANKNLEVVDLANTDPVTIESNAFYRCNKLRDLIIRSNTMVSLPYDNYFNNTLIGQNAGAVYVPDNLVDTYKNDIYWNKYIIMPISVYPYDVVSAQWEEVVNNTTTYKTDYSIGKKIPLVIDGVNCDMELVAFDTDIKADGSGKARMTWMAKNIFAKKKMNSTNTNANGWPSTAMRSWLRSDVWNQLPDVLRNNIVEVNKTYYDQTSKTTKTSVDTIWIPSNREIYGSKGGSSTYAVESSGVDYTAKLYNLSEKIRNDPSGSKMWWLRTATINTSYFEYVSSSASLMALGASNTEGVVLCFCI